MTWLNRLRQAAYTSPSGNRIIFQYEDVSRAFSRKSTAFEFPDADGTYIQDLGRSGRRFELRIFFSGPNHDLEARAFDRALSEIGTGRLEHPMYGVFDVVPFGEINQRDDLKTAANQTVFELTFWDTINVIYQTAQDDIFKNILSGISDFNFAASNEFENSIRLITAFSEAVFKNNFLSLLNSTSSQLRPIANTQDSVKRQFDAINSSIVNSINVDDPETLSLQTMLMIQSPARADTSVTIRLDTYRDVIAAIINLGIINPRSNRNAPSDFRSRDVYVSTSVTGFILSVLNNRFTIKKDAINAADFILTQFEIISSWRDDNFTALGEVDTGEAYQQLQETVALTAGYLVELSFTLKQERRFKIDRNRTIIDLTAQLYGVVDEQLDFFINSNNLSGSEILEIPRGREIVYYV